MVEVPDALPIVRSIVIKTARAHQARWKGEKQVSGYNLIRWAQHASPVGQGPTKNSIGISLIAINDRFMPADLCHSNRRSIMADETKLLVKTEHNNPFPTSYAYNNTYTPGTRSERTFYT